MEFVLGGVSFVLLGLLLYQQRFYTGLVRELVERLSTRNLYEYNQIKNPPPPRKRPEPIPVVTDQSIDRILG